MLNEIAYTIVISYLLVKKLLRVKINTELIAVHSGKSTWITSFRIGARWDLIEYHLLDQRFCVLLKIAFPQILFISFFFFFLQDCQSRCLQVRAI